MPYEEWEIVELYKNSKNKVREIGVLAELNLTSKDKIIEILVKNGVEIKSHKPYQAIRQCVCKICGKKFKGYSNSKFCERCNDWKKRKSEWDFFNNYRSKMADRIEELEETRDSHDAELITYRRELKEFDEYIHGKG